MQPVRRQLTSWRFCEMTSGGASGGTTAFSEWVYRNAIAILASIFTIGSTFAIVVERTSSLAADVKELEASLSAQLDAFNLRMNSYDREGRLAADKAIRTELELAAQDKAISGIIAQRDARLQARDVEIEALSTRLARLEDADREQGQWRAALTERFNYMRQQLDNIAAVLDRRLPKEPPSIRPDL